MILGAEKSPSIGRSIDRSLPPQTQRQQLASRIGSAFLFFAFARPAAFRVCFGDCPGERCCVKRCGLPYGGSYPAGHTYGHLHIRYSKTINLSRVLVSGKGGEGEGNERVQGDDFIPLAI